MALKSEGKEDVADFLSQIEGKTITSAWHWDGEIFMRMKEGDILRITANFQGYPAKMSMRFMPSEETIDEQTKG